MLVKIDTYVVAPGKLVVKDYKKSVQYNAAASVSKVLVREGEFVKQGQPLLEVENTDKEADFKATKKNYYALLAKRDRILSELHGYREIKFSKTFSSLPDESLKEHYRKLEEKVFNNDRKFLLNLQDLYREKEQLLKEKILGLEEALKKKRDYLDYIRNQIATEESLVTQGLTDNTRLLDLRSREKLTEYDLVNLKSQLDQTRKQLSTVIAEYNSRVEEFKNKLSKELEDVTFRLGRLKDELVKYKFYVKRTIIKAPASGQVIGLTIHSKGEVIKPGETIMYIVPKERDMFINARVNPKDIDKVHKGQLVDVRFPSFLSIAANSVEGKVTYVSSDTLFDRNSRTEYYEVHIALTPKGKEQIKKYGFQLVAGMPAVGYIRAEKVTPLEYMLQPLIILLKSAFRAA